MDGSHLKNADTRPKRRKDQDNPYEIFTTGSNTSCPHFYLSFKDSKRMDVDTFLETVRRYTNATEITQRMVAELIDHIDVYHAEKKDGVTTQRITI